MESILLKSLEEEEKELNTRFNDLMDELKQSSIHGDFFADKIINLMNELIDIKIECTLLKLDRLEAIRETSEAIRYALNTYNKGGEKDDEEKADLRNA